MPIDWTQPIQTWQPIGTEAEWPPEDILLWNGVTVFPGWKDDDGWHDSRNVEHDDRPESPQPTHWMDMPLPPGVVDWAKPIQTRDGQPANLLSIHATGPIFTVVVEVANGTGEWYARSCTALGEYTPGAINVLDIVNATKEQ